VLTCEECGRVSEGAATGWRGYVSIDGAAAFYCPACNEREFGGGADAERGYEDAEAFVRALIDRAARKRPEGTSS
jgi:hypothetical protein